MKAIAKSATAAAAAASLNNPELTLIHAGQIFH